MKQLLSLILVSLALVCGSQEVRADLTSGLVGYWSFNDGTGTDNSGNGHDGTVSGATSAAGACDGALSFDGVNDHVSVPNSQALNPSSISIAAWLNYSIDPPGATYAINKAGDSDRGYAIGDGYHPGTDVPTSWDTYTFTIATGSTYYSVNSNVPIKVGQNTFVVGTYDDAAGVARIYVDGVFANSTPIGPITPDTDILSFGAHPNGDYWFPGIIDEVRIYNRALTESEVGELYGLCATPDVIPTLSEWGAIVFGLLLLISVIFYITRRSRLQHQQA